MAPAKRCNFLGLTCHIDHTNHRLGQVNNKRCQEWTMEYVRHLVAKGIMGAGAIQIVQSKRDPPTLWNWPAARRSTLSTAWTDPVTCIWTFLVPSILELMLGSIFCVRCLVWLLGWLLPGSLFEMFRARKDPTQGLTGVYFANGNSISPMSVIFTRHCFFVFCLSALASSRVSGFIL